MQFTITTFTALFVASTLALPAPQTSNTTPTTTVSFINDQSGAHAPVTAPLDGTVINLYNALTGSPIGVPNQVKASSAQLVAYPQNVDCTIYDINGKLLGQLTATHTYVDLDANSGSAQPIILDGATMSCTPLALTASS